MFKIYGVLKMTDSSCIVEKSRTVSSDGVQWKWQYCTACGCRVGEEGIAWHEDGDCCTEIH